MPGRGEGRLFVLSGPSGVGKDAVIERLKARPGRPGERDRHFVVTATTRPARPGERDGVDYVFMSVDEFSELVASDGLLEWANVYGNFYGSPKSQVANALERGQDVVLKIDVQGAASVKRLYPDATLIFLEPPDAATLESRLRTRNTESGEALRVKLDSARSELREASRFDHRVVNRDGELDEAAKAIEEIMSR